jgi:acyl-coenzyme A synthetase/AMP-(fatty) acid ligase
LPQVEIRIEGSSQQILVRSPYIFSQNQSFLMGDRAEWVEAKQFRLLGRVDRVAKVEEKRVSFEEMEQHIMATGLVSECRLLLVKRVQQASKEQRTAIGCVAVLSAKGKVKLKQGKLSLVNELKRLLRQYFEPVVLPRKWRFVDTLPINAQGKISHLDLLQLFERNNDARA